MDELSKEQSLVTAPSPSDPVLKDHIEPKVQRHPFWHLTVEGSLSFSSKAMLKRLLQKKVLLVAK